MTQLNSISENYSKGSASIKIGDKRVNYSIVALFLTAFISFRFKFQSCPRILFQERETEKIAEEAGVMRDAKLELQPSRSPDSWQGSSFYQHVNAIKGT